MSYEGYEQCICENGHYFQNDDIFSGMYDDDWKPECPECKSPAAWINSVDCTNVWDDGVIPDSALESFLISKAEQETCNLGHVHQTKPAVYRVPTRKETNLLRVYNEEG